ncbi:NrfD/PsrC family molybdoenzyme membrane anchor subunit [Gephyromycinifex aptenodytis]|uniref:NrfD/PsrC family molybdoenzyme membrane anchor subunit n=1 Tax=Gephyromycinifex aptenodytis TaxID=2716227 RepID=UPI001D03337A|nr:NrfD/PsrC family molybdoenzyme membrane anchor subunit [Gephyromycinifex aptenodytis]
MSTPYSPDQQPHTPSMAQRGYALPSTPGAGQRPDEPIVITPAEGEVDSLETTTEAASAPKRAEPARQRHLAGVSNLADTAGRRASRLSAAAKKKSGGLGRGRSKRKQSAPAQTPGIGVYQPPIQPSPVPSRPDSAQTPRRRRKGQREDIMVPPVKFSSYYGRNIVKPAPWKSEIPSYLYLGGLAAGSALVAAGGEMTGRTQLQRNSRLIALAALGGSTGALVKDLGKPSRFLNMLRTVKLTSPMSIGSWILSGFGAFSAVAAFSEVMHYVLPEDVPGAAFWPVGDRMASLGAGAFAAPLAAYTSVLLSDTATPTWHGAYRQMPFVFVGSALAAAGGAAMAVTDPSETAPARRMAVGGAILEYGAFELMERALGVCAEPLHDDKPDVFLRTAKAMTLGGAALAAVGGGRRPLAVAAGLALNIGSALTRFGIFEAGMISARDPKYTVLPQRERLEQRRRDAELAGRSGATTSGSV